MTKQRLALSLDDYTFNLISRLSEDLGKTKSSVVIELFHLMGPALSHISACKQMVDQGLKNTGEGAFRAFLQGMREDFEESVEEANEAFTAAQRLEGEDAESMQADAPAPRALVQN